MKRRSAKRMKRRGPKQKEGESRYARKKTYCREHDCEAVDLIDEPIKPWRFPILAGERKWL